MANDKTLSRRLALAATATLALAAPLSAVGSDCAGTGSPCGIDCVMYDIQLVAEYVYDLPVTEP